MKTFHPIFLLTLMLFTSLQGFAQDNACVSKGKTIAPTERTQKDADGKDADTESWKSWKLLHSDWAVRQSWKCCPGLKTNDKTGSCDDPSLVDDSLVSCTTHGSCSAEKGCYPLREDDMFATESEDASVIEAMRVKEEKYNEQMNSLGDADPKENGASCFRDFECASYKCGGFKCVENKICRLADKGEQAPGNIKCEEPFEKNGSTSTCGDASSTYYPGLLGKISVLQVGGQQCQFELVPGTAGLNADTVKQAANLGVATTRSLEWLFATTSVQERNDCLFTNRWVKESMNGLIDIRKEVLRKFNVEYKALEKDYAKISSAKKDDMTQVTSPCGDVTTAHDIALRRATGLDYLCYMQKRNLVFDEYEAAMKKHVTQMHAKVSQKYSTAWGWGEKEKSWTIGDWSKKWDDHKCRSWPSWHRKIKRRWSQKYVVRGKSADNQAALTSPMLKTYLGFVNHTSPDEGVNLFKKRKYYLMDPLMPGGQGQSVSFENYGIGDQYERQLGYLGKAPVYNYQGIKDNYRAKIITHLKSLKKDGTTDGDFIFEPEIPSSFENRVCIQELDKPECARFKAIRDSGGCINNLDKTECSKMKTYVDTLQDVAFAQFLAYSYHTKSKYKDFFDNNGTMRRRLFERVDTDIANLQEYYTALATLRKNQNECIDRVVKQLQSSDFNGSGKGIIPGAGSYYAAPAAGQIGIVTDPTKGAVKTVNKGSPSMINLKVDGKSVSDKVALKGVTSQISDAGTAGLDASASNSLAAKVRAMQAANTKAISDGVNVAAKTQEFTSSLAAGNILGSSSGSSASRSGNSNANSDGALSGAAGNKATLDKLDVKGSGSSASSGSRGFHGDGTDAAAGGAQSLGNSTDPAGASGSSYGVSANSAMGFGAQGALTGKKGELTEAEQENINANYERTKGQYETHEDDSLFQVLSKTYVRNLDKVLIRKKKLDDDAASYPSVPSTP